MILAGGLGTRMKSAVPKVLHDILGHPVLWYVVEALKDIDAHPIVVTPEANDAFRAAFGSRLTYAVQPEQHGSGHAVQCGMEHVSAEYVLICSGDNPFPTADDYHEFLDDSVAEHAEAAVLAAHLEDAGQLGRIVRAQDGAFVGIVEARDARPEQLGIHEINTGVYLFRSAELRRWLGEMKPNNAQGEYYITDCISTAVQDGSHVHCHVAHGVWEMSGVNDRAELVVAASLLQRRKLDHLFRAGVTIDMPGTVRIDWDVVVGRDSEIRQGSCLKGSTRVGTSSVIGPNTILIDAQVGDETTVLASIVEGSTIGSNCAVGPFSYIRPGTLTAERSKVGAFCELKASSLGAGSKVPHLSYIGDASIAENVNVGAGTITCNYDGFTRVKHHTVIEKDVFIGANNNLVAPVTIHEGAYTATGSTITHDVPPEALGIARAVQVDKEGWVRRKKNGQ
ncbi:MAG: bifunctional UDP-N-acetylglucosamine diphosphorylase/glucosamine-1-phosphate N-acetyltransferase GlmU [Caldiserica bacterium]|nr:bifunctional UDP-N-acetylglucosamine diphosphorylase/glucosamine-1-phosphate N-acetyltransferase GlmU [Caldisericota bacterium]